MVIIKRDLFEELKNHLSAKEISLIIGPRQVGKTTLMLLLKEYLEKRGEKTLFLNLLFVDNLLQVNCLSPNR
jgi:predicted AAA+ superfamily ATPase